MHGESIEIEKQKSTLSTKKNEFISLTHYHRRENEYYSKFRMELKEQILLLFILALGISIDK